MSNHKHTSFDNYFLSIPPKPEELWRHHMQLLYDAMSRSCIDPVIVRGVWYYVMDDEEQSELTEGELMIAVRKEIYKDFLPEFLKLHDNFLGEIQKLPLEAKLKPEERKSIVSNVIDIYKNLIDAINTLDEPNYIDSQIENTILKYPKEFREYVRSLILKTATEIKCFNFPFKEKWFNASKNYDGARGEYLLLKDRIKNIKSKALVFVPYAIETESYQSRLKFTKESLARFNLKEIVEQRFLNILQS